VVVGVRRLLIVRFVLVGFHDDHLPKNR